MRWGYKAVEVDSRLVRSCPDRPFSTDTRRRRDVRNEGGKRTQSITSPSLLHVDIDQYSSDPTLGGGIFDSELIMAVEPGRRRVKCLFARRLLPVASRSGIRLN